MLDNPPTGDTLGPQDDLRRGYKQWEERHCRIMQEPPTEGRDYINHALNIFPFIEVISEVHPIAKGQSSARRNYRLLRFIFLVLLLRCHLGIQGRVIARTNTGGKRKACGCCVSCRNGHDADVLRVSGFSCVECKL